jgi:hypothetical protein
MWIYNNKEVIEQPDLAIGFIYKITNLTNDRIYIGKKLFIKYWQKYYGSSEELKADVKLLGHQSFKRDIIRFCNTKIDLTYYEVYYQCMHNVLTSNSYNRSILGKFYKGKISQ